MVLISLTFYHGQRHFSWTLLGIHDFDKSFFNSMIDQYVNIIKNCNAEEPQLSCSFTRSMRNSVLKSHEIIVTDRQQTTTVNNNNQMATYFIDAFIFETPFTAQLIVISSVQQRRRTSIFTFHNLIKTSLINFKHKEHSTKLKNYEISDNIGRSCFYCCNLASLKTGAGYFGDFTVPMLPNES